MKNIYLKIITLVIISIIVLFNTCYLSQSETDNKSEEKTSKDNKDEEKPPYIYNPPAETFDDADKPTFDLYTYNDGTDHTYKLLKPWNYDKSHNATRKYPLIVSLHGSTSLTDYYYAPVIVNKVDQMKAYPCFLLSPNNTNKGWGSNAKWVREVIEDLRSNYRIDDNLIYLMGFSMGGSGSYIFAKDYYTEYGVIFAGIVRLAGQTQTILPDAIADKTSIWYHIGLVDSAARVTVAEEAYQFIKNYAGNAGAVESVVNDIVATYARKTKTLKKNAVEFMKKSEYTGMGHNGSSPFKDPSVLVWLFNQSLVNR